MSINDLYDTIVLCHKILDEPDKTIDQSVQEVRLRLREALTNWGIAHNKCNH